MKKDFPGFNTAHFRQFPAARRQHGLKEASSDRLTLSEAPFQCWNGRKGISDISPASLTLHNDRLGVSSAGEEVRGVSLRLCFFLSSHNCQFLCNTIDVSEGRLSVIPSGSWRKIQGINMLPLDAVRRQVVQPGSSEAH